MKKKLIMLVGGLVLALSGTVAQASGCGYGSHGYHGYHGHHYNSCKVCYIPRPRPRPCNYCSYGHSEISFIWP